MILIAAFMVSCEGDSHAKLKAGKGDSLMFAAGEARNYKRVIELADSLEAEGDITSQNANRWRGVAYYHQKQMRSAEVYYKRVVESDIKNESDELNYYKSARRLATLLLKKGDYNDALHIAMDALWKLRENDRASDTDAAMLMNAIGCCQLNLGRTEQAANNFERSYNTFMKIAANDSIGRLMLMAFESVVSTTDEYINAQRYEEALPWVERASNLVDKFCLAQTTPDAVRDSITDDARAQVCLLKAIVQQHNALPKEAAKAYREGVNTRYGMTGQGRLYANDYLMAAGRYAEAADNFCDLDQLMQESGIELTLDNILQYLVPKFRANVGALRKDSAIAVGIKISEALDDAILMAKKDDAAELATIYDTQQQEAEIARQQADLTKQRLIGTALALVLIVTFFSVYTYHKRKAQHHLAVAHSKLQAAYDQLEETTAIKERIESELRIARDIQMSMVPNIFPDRPGLDIYASMTPAKEVGGDLYGYLLLENELYFCLGDVSGKGVPASLFMAQATRLFRTLATQHMMPEEIATRMNNALTEDNEQGMFVTMFIGLINLDSGKLVFCNAGHNPPVRLAKKGETTDGSRGAEFIDVLSNAPIGLFPGIDYEGESIDNIKDTPLFLYSDGLNEAEDKNQKQFGDEQILSILRYTHFENARQVIEKMNAEVEKHRKGAAPNDDLTIFCLSVKDPI
jgi:serine phosphatase RsbU (regulator of sigma subunit)